MSETMYNQYCIAGFNPNQKRWYREHPLFRTYEEAFEYLKKNRNTRQFIKFSKFQIKHRKITLWKNIEVGLGDDK